MKRQRELLSNTAILAVGQFFPQLTALIVMPIYTGMLTKAEYGRFDLINTVVYILEICLLVQMHRAVFRFLIDVRGEEEQESYISTAFFFGLFFSVLGSVALGLFYSDLGPTVQILLTVYLFLNLQICMVGQTVRGLGHNGVFSIGAIIQALTNLLLVVLFVAKLKLGFVGLFLALDIGLFLAVSYQMIYCRLYRFLRLRAFRVSVLKKMLSYAWPMVPNSLSLWVIETCDKYIIRVFLGVEYNGIFAVAQKIPKFFTLAYGTFNMAWHESASMSIQDEDHDLYYESVFHALLEFLTGCMLLLIVATPILFSILIRGSYQEAYRQMPLLFMGVFFSCFSSFYGGIYVARKATKAVGVSSAIGAVINAAVNLSMVRSFGLYAASVSTIVSYFVLSGYRLWDINRKKYAVIHYNFRKITLCLSSILLCSVLCFLQNPWCNAVNLLLGISGFVLLNHKMMLSIFRMIVKKIRH